VPLPGQNILYLDVDVVAGHLCIAGSGHSTDGAFLWNDAVNDWILVYDGRPYGTSPCKFGPLGLYVSIEGGVDNIRVYNPLTGVFKFALTKSVGARGIAMITGAGDQPEDLHSQDGWYGRGGFAEYLELADDLRVGQGATGGLCACERDGLLVTLEPGDNQFIRGRLDGSLITVSAWQRDRARSVILRLERAELQTMAPTPVEIPEIPAINRQLWLGFFTGHQFSGGGWSTAVSPQTLPGNCFLLIPDGLLLTKAGVTIGQWCAASPGDTIADVEAAAQRIAVIGRRPIAYWDARSWPRRPVLPVGSICCVQAYCRVDEPVTVFEAGLRGVVMHVASYGYDVALIAQCFTSNASLTRDLASLVPVYARVARDIASVVAILSFSGAGRATGLQDQPSELRSLWEQLTASVTTPVLSSPSVPTPQPTPKPTTLFPAAKSSGVPMKVYLKKSGKYVGCAPNSEEVYADRQHGGAWEEVELEKKGDRFIANLVAAQRVLSLEPNGTLSTRPAGTSGAYEQMYATTQPDGSNLLYRFHDGNILPVLQIESA
jgi:hypothetical protein